MEGKNITFYATPKTLKALEEANLKPGQKSAFIASAIESYSRLAEIEKRIELLYTASAQTYLKVTGKSIEELQGALAARKRLAKIKE